MWKRKGIIRPLNPIFVLSKLKEFYSNLSNSIRMSNKFEREERILKSRREALTNCEKFCNLSESVLYYENVLKYFNAGRV